MANVLRMAQFLITTKKEIDMTTPIELVSEFCNVFTTDHGRTAIKRWFTPNTVWNNVGIASTTGMDDAIAFIEELETSMGIATVHIEMLAIAADGDRVLTERLDIFERADGSEIGRVTLMGIFEIEGDRIAAWRDYAHPNSMTMTAAS
jgi:limonene-1,2-epoxide hydrolase